MRRRIELADPGPEGTVLADALRAAGHEVERIEVADVPRTGADALVLAGDAEGALEALRALRDDGPSPDTPVVLVGTPLGTTHRGEGEPGFGAQAVLNRPVAAEHLVAVLARLLAPPVDPASSTAPRSTTERPRPAPAVTLSGALAGIRPESTLQLADTSTAPVRAAHSRDAREPGAGGARTSTPAWSHERTPATGTGESSAHATAAISDRLRALLEAADRRVFPGRPPIDLSLPGGGDSALELLPPEVLESHDVAIDAVALAGEEDPIDAFTFVGGPVLPHVQAAELSNGEPGPPPREPEGSAAASPSPAVDPEAPAPPKTAPGTPTSLSKRPSRLAPSATPPPPRPPATHVGPADGRSGVHAAEPAAPRAPAPEWPLEDSVLGRATPDGGRRGSLGEGGALRLLLRLSDLRLDALLTIVPVAGPAEPLADAVTLTFVAGDLAALETPTARRAVALLRRRGAVIGAGDDETSARRALDEAAQRGAITRYERARAEREARLESLCAVLASGRGTFSITRLEPSDVPRPGPSPLGMPLRLALFELARRALSGERAHAVLGGPTATLRRGPRWEAVAAEGLIPPELAELLTEREGASAAEVAAAAPDEPGLLGLFCALIASGALAAQPGAPAEPSLDERRRHARRLVEEAARIAEDADYFTILGIAPDASARDVEQAYLRRREQLEALPLAELELGALVALRRTALESLDEAYRVLERPRWREAYAHALAHGPALAVPTGEH